MEVFLRNVPAELTDRSLLSQLKPFLDNLGIEEGSYQCEKYRKKAFATITFLCKKDGETFLAHHGEVAANVLTSRNPNQPFQGPAMNKHHHSPTKPFARLKLMEKWVYCKVSTNHPTELALAAIQYSLNKKREMEEQKKAKQEKPSQSYADNVEEKNILFDVSATSCGHWMFIEGRLTFFAEWMARGPATAKFTKRNLIIKIAPRGLEFKGAEIRIPFPIIQELVWSEDGRIAITLNSAPTFLTALPTQGDEIVQLMQSFLLSNGNRPQQQVRVPAIDDEHSKISSFCLVYHIEVQMPISATRGVQGSKLYFDQVTKLKRKELFEVTKFDFKSNISPSDHRFYQAVFVFKQRLSNYEKEGVLPFNFLFLLQRLVYDGYLHPYTVCDIARRLVELFKESKGKSDGRHPISVDAFKRLFRSIEYPSPLTDPKHFEPDAIMEYLEGLEAEIRGGLAVSSELFRETDNLVKIYRAQVTPTRILLDEGMEAKNRILRKFPDHPDYFVRVQFTDENGQDLYFNSKVSLDSIYERFKNVLANGISIGGRIYGFLGFSHSSLRSHSVWLSAPFFYSGQMQIPQLIITSLGEFRQIKSPARRAARIGQAFSETPFTVSLDDFGIEVLKIQDVERNSRVFSDGVGPMSWGAMEAIHNVIPQSKGLPTCVQFRWAGAKGMLALDTRLTGNQFCIRPSMEKFLSEDMLNLEICDMASKPIPLVLNRQLVKILEDMGGPESWLMNLQEEELQRLRKITVSVESLAHFLRTQSIGDSINLSRFLRQVDRMGVDYRRDRFLYAVVNAAVLKELRLLKHKARIPVPEGMTLFGVMDETGFLEEGQVFVTYDTMSGRHEWPPETDVRVIVTRSPALHPGDIQLARNRIPPDDHPLSQLGNCIVFSQKGERDLPSQLSGGDLDGDVFNVIWDPELVSMVKTFPPADYARVDPLELDRPVVSADMADFFIDFMKTDHLGVIATRHMILADQRNEGTLDGDCIRLAELHSSAVDFSKTGRAVALTQLPKAPKWRPDFLAPGPHVIVHNKHDIEMDSYMHQDNDEDEDEDEGPRHRYYESDRVLGRLYRAVDEQKIWNEDVRRVLPMGGASFWDQLIAKFKERISGIGDVDWRHRTDEARRLRLAYEDAMLEIMTENAENPSQPLRELEVFVGFIINKSGVQTRRQRDRSIRLRDEFERITSWIMRQMRHPPSSHTTGIMNDLDALELCLACVHVGCMREREPHEIPSYTTRALNQEVESFRVVAACALMRELNTLEMGTKTYNRGGGGGGFVGVR